MTPAFQPKEGPTGTPAVSPVFDAAYGDDATDAPVAMAAGLRRAGLIGDADQITAVSTPPPIQPRHASPRLQTVRLHDGQQVEVITEPPPPLRDEDLGSLVPRQAKSAVINQWDIETPVYDPPPTLATRSPVVHDETDLFSYLPVLAGMAVIATFIYVLWFVDFT